MATATRPAARAERRRVRIEERREIFSSVVVVLFAAISRTKRKFRIDRVKREVEKTTGSIEAISLVPTTSC